MTAIGIIGANGQVGTEACVFLSRMPGINVVAICRKPLAAALLRRCDLDCRFGSLENAESAKRLLDGCDVVVDLTMPAGSHAEIRATIERNVSMAVQHAAPGARYVYMSSEMAYGMPQSERYLQGRRICRTIYGSTKRFGESLTFQRGLRFGREVYALRLGQVHGVIQNVSRECLRMVHPGTVHVPDTPSDTVFVFSIAEALANIGAGLERPGLYTLVSVPSWTWAEIYQYYADLRGVVCDLRKFPLPQRLGAIGRLCSTITSAALEFMVAYREVASAYILHRLAESERRLVGVYRLRNAAREIGQLEASRRYEPFRTLLGEAPGERLRSLSDSRLTMHGPTDEVRRILGAACAPPALAAEA